MRQLLKLILEKSSAASEADVGAIISIISVVLVIFFFCVNASKISGSPEHCSICAKSLIAHDDLVEIETTETLAINPLKKVEGDGPLRLESVTLPQNGTLRTQGNLVEYTPNRGCGSDEFSFIVSDRHGATATAKIKVLPKMLGENFEVVGLSEFAFDSTNLSDRNLCLIHRFAERLGRTQPKPQQRIRIVGHSCDIGSAAYNKRLSLQRANVTRDALRDTMRASSGQNWIERIDKLEKEGSAVPLVQTSHCSAYRGDKNTYRACVAPNRRVQIALTSD